MRRSEPENYDAWAGRIARATEAGRTAAGMPIAGFNSENFDVTAPGWNSVPNLLNSDGYRANLVNHWREEWRKAGY